MRPFEAMRWSDIVVLPWSTCARMQMFLMRSCHTEQPVTQVCSDITHDSGLRLAGMPSSGHTSVLCGQTAFCLSWQSQTCRRASFQQKWAGLTAALTEKEANMQSLRTSADATKIRLTVLLCSCTSSCVVTFITRFVNPPGKITL